MAIAVVPDGAAPTVLRWPFEVRYMKSRFAFLTAAVLGCAGTLLADFQYQQTTKITGGAMQSMMRVAGAFSRQAREPIVSDVYLKGNRMATVTRQNATIIDLDKETFTNIDFDKKQYSVLTFQQMKQAIEDAMAEAKKQKTEGSDADIKFTASVKETGATKQISGLNTTEYILTMAMEGTDKKSGQSGAMNMTNDMWMASDIPGYEQVRDFNVKMAAKMGSIFGGAGAGPLGMARPDMMKGMAEMAKEMSKLKGVPVLAVMRMGSTADGKPLPAASEAPAAAETKGPDVKEATGKAALGRLGGLAGGLGGFGRKKKQEEAPAAEQKEAPAAASGGGAAILLETTTEYSGFSSGSVDSAKVDVPAGFKQVESEMLKRRR